MRKEKKIFLLKGKEGELKDAIEIIVNWDNIIDPPKEFVTSIDIINLNNAIIKEYDNIESIIEH